MSPATIHRHEPLPTGAQVPRVQAVTGASRAEGSLFPENRASTALRHLAEAAGFARELGRDPWDFAVEIQTFRALGLTNNDFRWLVCKGLVAHQQEVTEVGDTHRVFQSDRALSFSEKTCFVLSPAGLAYIGTGLSLFEPPALNGVHEAADLSPLASRNGNGKDSTLVPKWDRERQELRVGNLVVKQFKVPALNQERILAAFEEEGWPVVIDDPLPPHPEQDPKRRLHDTIISLNRNQKHPLIHFLGNGNGQGIRWRLSPGQNARQ